MSQKTSPVLFASAHPERMDRDCTLPAKFMRLLDRMPIKDRVKGKTVAIKMHIGGGIGYSTIHPLFVKLLVDHVKTGKPRDVFVTDGTVQGASDRGYTRETIGVRLLPVIGKNGRNVVKVKTGWKPMESVLMGRQILNADVLINFSHVKGHGACGFGAACKNLAMGCVSPKSRGAMHSLEGNLVWDKTRCIRCKKCITECQSKANTFNKEGNYEVFWHNCKMCMHCRLACPTGALVLQNRKFDLFQEGLARVTKLVLDSFKPALRFHINILSQVTLYCDCWGYTTPSLVPDVGIFAGQDIVAVDTASLDAIKIKNLIPGSITPPYKLLKKGTHLFERIHGKNPYIQGKVLEHLGMGSTKYRVIEVK
jgi:uncharacterized Fe-S center protein